MMYDFNGCRFQNTTIEIPKGVTGLTIRGGLFSLVELNDDNVKLRLSNSGRVINIPDIFDSTEDRLAAQAERIEQLELDLSRLEKIVDELLQVNDDRTR